MVFLNAFIITMHSHGKWLSSNFNMSSQYANSSIFMMYNPLLHILYKISLYLTLMPHSLTWRWKTLCLSKYFFFLFSPNSFMIHHSAYHTLISFQKKSYNSLSDSKFLFLGESDIDQTCEVRKRTQRATLGHNFKYLRSTVIDIK